MRVHRELMNAGHDQRHDDEQHRTSATVLQPGLNPDRNRCETYDQQSGAKGRGSVGVMCDRLARMRLKQPRRERHDPYDQKCQACEQTRALVVGPFSEPLEEPFAHVADARPSVAFAAVVAGIAFDRFRHFTRTPQARSVRQGDRNRVILWKTQVWPARITDVPSEGHHMHGRHLLVLILGLLFVLPARGEPPTPETYRVGVRYQINAFTNERIVQYRDMVKKLEQQGLDLDPLPEGDELDANE